ncbi:hypothetical protein EL26_16310 [Tumebacillus flagellatus]|uniref:Uncharacterized protein n=1 Tax=Tumebacillus flagellatus TaxID=1157490 RepID=A0A074LM79_9BACL|nr:hypothetical protein EL26_16310 [Tumebacillus flagellatus]
MLNSLATQMDHILELQRQAQQYEMASWEYSGDTPDDLHHRQNLARQAARLHQQAEWEANQADFHAADKLHLLLSMIPDVSTHGSHMGGSSDNLDELPEPMRSYYRRHPELREDDGSSTITDNDLHLTPEQKRRAQKEETLQKQMEEEQKPQSIESLLALYYITKRDFNDNVPANEIIKQNLALDNITTEEQLRKHIDMQLRIIQENDEVDKYCSIVENQRDPFCTMYHYNQAGGLDPASAVGTSYAISQILSPAILKGISYIKEKIVPSSNSTQVALPGGGSIKVDMIQASGEHTEGYTKSSNQVASPNGEILNVSPNIINRVKELRSQLPSKLKKSGNFGYAEVDIQGIDKKEFFAHSSVNTFEDNGALSGISIKPQDKPLFEAKKVDPDNARIDTPEAYLRDYDTEYKILNDIVSKLGNNKDARGTIKLFTERLTCQSCSDIILQFRNMYPNVKLIVLTNDGKIVK